MNWLKRTFFKKKEPDDRRTVNLTLSEKAITQFNSIKNKSFSEFFSLFEVLSDDELLDYYKLNNKIIGNKPEDSRPGKDKLHV